MGSSGRQSCFVSPPPPGPPCGGYYFLGLATSSIRVLLFFRGLRVFVTTIAAFCANLVH